MAHIPDIEIERRVPARMRDGVHLYADIYRPRSAGSFPVIVQRTPYNRQDAGHGLYRHPAWYARHGYIVVVQDTRGRWDSQGEFYPFRDEMTDSYDTVEWAAALPGSTGRVGTYGFSYPGAVQLMAALMRPPHLACIVPGFTTLDIYNEWIYTDGALNLAFDLFWVVYLAIDTAHRAGRADLERELVVALPRLSEWHTWLPLSDIPILKTIEALIPYWRDWLDHPVDGDYWRRWSLTGRYQQVSVPALHIGGWYDSFREGTLAAFRHLQREAADERARQGQRLLMGPWVHIPWSRVVGELDFGPEATNSINEHQLRFFDRWLKDVMPASDDDLPARVFVMGANRWQSMATFPPPDARPTPYYLRSAWGGAGSLDGDGRLSLTAPGDEPPDFYTYDPRAPVASLGGHACGSPAAVPMGPADQRPVESQGQVLVFTSEPLPQDITIMGLVSASLWISSTAADTDFTVKLVDVHPDGRAYNLAEGILRASYRDSLAELTPFEPGAVYRLNIRVGSTCAVIKAGHCIRVDVSSSHFPHWDRNTNSGHMPAKDSFHSLTIANQTVFHDAQRPSHVLLPIVAGL